MKKKVRDLTLNEIKDICLKNHCFTCPLHDYKCIGALNVWLEARDDEIGVEVKE